MCVTGVGARLDAPVGGSLAAPTVLVIATAEGAEESKIALACFPLSATRR